MALELTFMSFAWLGYAAACVLLIAFFFQAPRLAWGMFALSALLLQQALGTVAVVLLYAADSAEMATQSFRNGAVAWVLWGPLVFLLAPLSLEGSRLRPLAWAVGGLGALPGLTVVLGSVFAPELLIVEGVGLSEYATASMVLTFVAFVATSALLAYEAMTTPAPLRRGQLALMASAVALEGAYHAGNNMAKVLAGGDFLGLAAPTGLHIGLVVVAAAGFLGLAGWLFYRSMDGRHVAQRQWARVIMSCILAAGITGAAASRLLEGEEFVSPTGLFHAAWDLLGLCLLVFAGLRYQLFAIEMRARQALTVGTVVVFGFVTFAVVENVAENFLQSTFFGALPASGTIAALFVAVPSALFVKAGRHIGHMLLPNVTRTVDYEHRRKEEIYAAALEGAFLDGVMSPAEANSIRRLKAKLEISDADHARLEARVRAQMTSSQPSVLGAVPA